MSSPWRMADLTPRDARCHQPLGVVGQDGAWDRRSIRHGAAPHQAHQALGYSAKLRNLGKDN